MSSTQTEDTEYGDTWVKCYSDAGYMAKKDLTQQEILRTETPVH